MIDFLSKPAVQSLLALCLAIGIFFGFRQIDLRYALTLGISLFLFRELQSKNFSFIFIMVGALSFIEGFRHSSLWLLLAPLAVATASLILVARHAIRERQSSNNAPPLPADEI